MLSQWFCRGGQGRNRKPMGAREAALAVGRAAMQASPSEAVANRADASQADAIETVSPPAEGIPPHHPRPRSIVTFIAFLVPILPVWPATGEHVAHGVMVGNLALVRGLTYWHSGAMQRLTPAEKKP
jgi:hypothetical protein